MVQQLNNASIAASLIRAFGLVLVLVLGDRDGGSKAD